MLLSLFIANSIVLLAFGGVLVLIIVAIIALRLLL